MTDEDRGVPDVDRPPEGLPHPDRIGAAEPMGTRASELGARPRTAPGWDRPADLEKELSKRRPLLVGLALRKEDSAITHYEVVIGFHPGDRRVATLDPARGWREWDWEDFDRVWSPARRLSLVCFKPEE